MVGFVNVVTILLVTEKAANALISSVVLQEGLCLLGWAVIIVWVDGNSVTVLRTKSRNVPDSNTPGVAKL